MLSVFEFINYREYLNGWIEAQGDRAYGMKGRIAAALRISSSLVSQVLKGEKSLTPDQASDLCDFLGLMELEADYLQLLVEFDRAASIRYKDKLKRKIAELQAQSRKIGRRVPRHKELNDEQKSIYYSSWIYTGIRNLTAVPGFQHADAIAQHLRLEPAVVHRVLNFLLENGLCKEEKGAITYGPASTHIDKDSPFVNKHHQNWRFQAIQHMERRQEDDVFFTSPMSLSIEAAEEIRSLIPTFVQSVMKISGPSESETAACLNIDWFRY
ncbi:MAG: TIGR02147 family protein [Calothrix sp. SM1_5_4]|nr:TIGR02147 family protein [Calothrix sp. SM1_5_4]